MEYHNTPSNLDPNVLNLREISERRATTISNMVDTAREAGIDDTFAEKAVYKYGEDNAKAWRATMADPDSFTAFATEFGTDHNREIYEMERVTETEDELEIHFHYCPYVAAWLKQGHDESDLPRLCDIAMAGDHAMADQFPQVEFELGNTIAKGATHCTLRFRRVETEGQ